MIKEMRQELAQLKRQVSNHSGSDCKVIIHPEVLTLEESKNFKVEGVDENDWYIFLVKPNLEVSQ